LIIKGFVKHNIEFNVVKMLPSPSLMTNAQNSQLTLLSRSSST